MRILLIILLAATAQADKLLDAMAQVESGGDCNAVGDYDAKTKTYRAIGCLQIWPITVKDCNRIIGRNKYTLADRYDRQKSYEMAGIIRKHYCKTDDEFIRRWKTGTNKPTKAGEIYRRKVKAEYEKR